MTTGSIRIVSAIIALVAGTSAPAWGQFYNKPKKDRAPAKEKSTDLEEYRDEADAVLAPLTGGAQSPVGTEDWTIVIVAFVGEEQAEAAQLGLHKVMSEGGLSGA